MVMILCILLIVMQTASNTNFPPSFLSPFSPQNEWKETIALRVHKKTLLPKTASVCVFPCVCATNSLLAPTLDSRGQTLAGLSQTLARSKVNRPRHDKQLL